MRKKLNFINVTRIFPNNVEFAVSEIRRQHSDVGIEKFALSLSFHPTGTPAIRHAQTLIEAFRKVKEALVDTPSIKVGVLLQSTLGHGWSGPVPLTGEKWQRIVKDNGNVSSRMCPTDPGFRKYVLDCVEGVMKVGPAFLLLDDDFGLRIGECFCPNHIALFNRATGIERSFEEVVSMLKERPENDSVVRFFSQQRGELAVDFAREIREVIDRYDDTITCTMCSPGNGQGFVKDVALALAGRHGTPSIRVNNAIYGSNQPQYLLQLTTSTNRIRNIYNGIPDLIDEADTFPQNYYSENAELFNAHLVNAILNGLTGAKLWMFEFELPRSINSQIRYEQIFREFQPLYEELFNTIDGVRWLGVTSPFANYQDLLHPFNAGKSLYQQDWHSTVLGPLAIPIRYGRPDEDDAIFAINGDIAERLSDDEIKAMLSKNALLDSKAVKALVARGFSELLGVSLGDNPKFFFQSELDDKMPAPMGLMWDASAAELKCLSDDTTVASWCILPNMETGKNEKVSPCMTFFQNRLGGRIVCLAWSSDMPFYKVLKNERRRLLLKALDFLKGGLFEMSLETRHQAIVRHGILKDASELVAVLSLALDAETTIPLRCAKKPASVELLATDGTWKNVTFTHQDNILTVNASLAICRPSILRIRR
ncbi:MAG: hypothetical protein IJS15_05950 [Victivallales bacterium]|nr:hypothetical protein [Victivallales bacterium]